MRQTTDERARHEAAHAAARLLTERRLQAIGLLVLAAIVLLVAVLRAGIHNVFLPHWWHLW